jgi:hypothetical protein
MTFMELVDQLSVWKFFPEGATRGHLAKKIADWCGGRIERGKYLLTKIDDFDEYPGPMTIRQLLVDRFEPTGPLARYEIPPAEAVGPRAPAACRRCEDAGTVITDGVSAWCDCEVARRLKADCPSWLAVLNGKSMRQ